MSLKQLKEASDKEFEEEFPPTETHHFGWGIRKEVDIKSFLHLQLEKAYKLGLRKGVEDTALIELNINDGNMELNPISGCSKAEFISSLNMSGSSQGVYHIEITKIKEELK